jgi:ABC-type multidrug transport system fused ATPase/permease subunit
MTALRREPAPWTVPTASAMIRNVSLTTENQTPRSAVEWRAMRDLAPHLWPAGNLAVRLRVVLALALLGAAKLATVYVPILLRDLVDLLSDPANLPIVVPLGLVVGYGALRIAAIAFSELRDAVFARVAQRAIRSVALATFRHLHGLSLGFHLERQTGGLSRAIERGTNGIDTLLTFMLFNIVPTLMEIALVCGVLWALFDASYAVVTLVCVVGYARMKLARGAADHGSGATGHDIVERRGERANAVDPHLERGHLGHVRVAALDEAAAAQVIALGEWPTARVPHQGESIRGNHHGSPGARATRVTLPCSSLAG